jgi:hypothetical protein
MRAHAFVRLYDVHASVRVFRQDKLSLVRADTRFSLDRTSIV